MSLLKHRIGVDLDGVLANFEAGFVKKLREAGCMVEFPIGDPTFPSCWDWPEYHGATTEQIDRAWDLVLRDATFWARLPSCATREEFHLLHEMINGDWQVYFITTRPGLFAQQQSAAWLQVRGIPNPAVLIADNAAQKGRLAKGLDLDAMIDDRPANLEAMPASVRPFLKLAPYNREWCETHSVPGVNNLREMMEIVVKIEQADEQVAA